MEENLEAGPVEPSGGDSAAGKSVNGGSGCFSDHRSVYQSPKFDDSLLVGATAPLAKRKRGRPPRGQAKRKKEEKEESEDVCFICFDGGNLVLCDHRGCPKAYHAACTKRDESFFRSKMKWQCGWHICTRCQKPSHYMCYTCTFSLCKKCTRDAEYVSVRGNKGFCGLCMRPIMLIENPGQGSQGMVNVDFDDKSSWEYLFKCYWICLKGKLSLTLDEILQAKNPWKWDNMASQGPHVDDLCRNVDVINLKRRKINECADLKTVKENPKTEVIVSSGTVEAIASKVAADTKSNDHVVTTVASQIAADTKSDDHVGETVASPVAADTKSDDHVGETVASPIAADTKNNDHEVMGSNKRTKECRTDEDAGQYANLSECAAIDVHNINLIYLRRNLIEKLLDDADKLHDRVVGSLVRIRISDCTEKQEFYRLVQVVGIRKASELYTVGTRKVDIILEVLNLDKKDFVSIDRISDEDFSEDECRHLHRNIRCGFIRPFTVGEIQEKAATLRAVRVKDWLEVELLRLYHRRDCANEQGHGKELKECVEKIELLNSPEELQRRLEEVPAVHADRNVDYHSETEEDTREFEKTKEDDPVKQSNPDSSKMQRDLIPSSREGCVLNQVGPTTLVTCDLNQLVVNSSEIVSENSLPLQSTEGKQSADISETEVIWLYLDPTGKVQGPFSRLQLQRWSLDGHFPPDLRIWRMNENQDSSILLTDVLNGLQHKNPLSFSNLFPQDVGVISSHGNSSWDDGPSGSSEAVQKDNKNLEGNQQPIQNDMDSGESSGKQTESDSYSGHISEQNLKSLPIVSSSKDWDSTAGSSSVADTIKESMQNHEVEVSDPANSVPKPSGGSVDGLDDENKQSVSGIPVQGSVPSWSASQSQPASDPSNWPEIVAEDEESVSDLLAEVEAMESLNATGPGTPTSAMNPCADLRAGSMDDCFSPVDCLEPASDPGKPDPVSTTELQPAVRQELHVNPQNQASLLDTQKQLGGHSSPGTEAERHARHRNVSCNEADAGRRTHPPLPTTDASHRPASEATDGRWGPVHQNANRSLGGLTQRNGTSNRGSGHGAAQGNSNSNWRTGQGAAPGNASSNWSSSGGNRDIWGSQTRYSGERFSPRDRGFQGGDLSRGRSTYNRQTYGGGGSYRHPPRGQRVCKFYESGYCKKGSSCSYWHP